jgi:lipopolysaccharide/colanic/teichoic acid biosynthesis glycosyltransferase
MARNSLHTSQDSAGLPALSQPLWKSLLFLAGALGLAAVSWIIAFWVEAFPGHWTLHVGEAGLFGALLAGLALSLEGALRWLGLSSPWRFRLAFLASLGWGLFILFAGLPLPGPQIQLLFLLAIFLGSFGGGVGASSLESGLWEDNSPPSLEVQQEVLALHRAELPSLPPTPAAKLAFDLLLAFFGLALAAPFWLTCAFLIWFEDPGPLLFVKNSVGRGGKNFHQFKFRTMVREAEKPTGPVLARRQDERVLHTGRLLRKTALDELPQLLNILKGEMSFVGPRPQRTVLVRDYLERMPEYAGRHAVLPGLAGLAQVAGDYYLTPRQKLRFDRVYIRHLSLGFDLKLIFLACLITFYFRWLPGWSGRLPRQFLH